MQTEYSKIIIKCDNLFNKLDDIVNYSVERVLVSISFELLIKLKNNMGETEFPAEMFHIIIYGMLTNTN